MRYQNKYFREVLEQDFQNRDIGVNIHCKEDGIYITVPPYPITCEDGYNYGFETEILREDHDTERIVNKIKEIMKDYSLKVDLEKAVYGDNIKIKLKVYGE
tara:strand:- start:1309 stop:1611 length:303 start_codon:yes stop_codon:yes gene_type:complete